MCACCRRLLGLIAAPVVRLVTHLVDFTLTARDAGAQCILGGVDQQCAKCVDCVALPAEIGRQDKTRCERQIGVCANNSCANRAAVERGLYDARGVLQLSLYSVYHRRADWQAYCTVSVVRVA